MHSLLISLCNGYGVYCLILFPSVFHAEQSQFVFHCSDFCLLLNIRFFSEMGLVSICLTHYICLSLVDGVWHMVTDLFVLT